MATYPYAHGCSPDPKGRWDKYWKYNNVDPSTARYGTIVSDEIFFETHEIINKRGKDIYGVRYEGIIVQDLHHEVIRQLVQKLTEHVKEIEEYELGIQEISQTTLILKRKKRNRMSRIKTEDLRIQQFIKNSQWQKNIID